MVVSSVSEAIICIDIVTNLCAMADCRDSELASLLAPHTHCTLPPQA